MALVISGGASSAYDARLDQAIREFAEDGITIDIANKQKSLLKFGENEDVQTTSTTLMTLPSGIYNETLPTGNAITHIASSSGSDTGTTVTIEGHTSSGSDLTFATQTKALQGQTKTALDTPLTRVTRVYASSGAALVGNVYVAEDVTFTGGVPQTATAIHIIIPAGQNQTQKTATAISSTDAWILTNMTASVLEKTAAFANVRIEFKNWQSSIWRPLTQYIGVSADSGTFEYDMYPYRRVPPNSDVRLVANASVNGTHVAGGITGILASVV